MNTKTMTVNQIRQLLIDNGADPQLVNAVKGKSALVKLLEEANLLAEPVEQLEDFEDEIDEFNFHKPIMPNANGWQEYIIGQLRADEKFKEYPKANGLRRLVEENIGPIVSMTTDIVQAPGPSNNYCATVRSTITINMNGNLEKYDGCAEAIKEYLVTPYDQHLSALAETRAEARAYRKILRLNTVSYEEMTNDSSILRESNDSKIAQEQILFINVLCGRNRGLNINVAKFFAWHFGERKSIENYTFDEAVKAQEILSSYQSDATKIPADLLGYDEEWRSYFG